MIITDSILNGGQPTEATFKNYFKWMGEAEPSMVEVELDVARAFPYGKRFETTVGRVRPAK